MKNNNIKKCVKLANERSENGVYFYTIEDAKVAIIDLYNQMKEDYSQATATNDELTSLEKWKVDSLDQIEVSVDIVACDSDNDFHSDFENYISGSTLTLLNELK